MFCRAKLLRAGTVWVFESMRRCTWFEALSEGEGRDKQLGIGLCSPKVWGDKERAEKKLTQRYALGAVSCLAADDKGYERYVSSRQGEEPCRSSPCPTIRGVCRSFMVRLGYSERILSNGPKGVGEHCNAHCTCRSRLQAPCDLSVIGFL
jgi:hypothetical protein